MSQQQKMNKYTVRKEIAALIDSIKQHSDSIGYNRQIPQLELELILHKIEKLYEKSIIFNYLNAIEDQEAPDTLTKDIAEATATVHQPVIKTEEEKKPAPQEIPQVKALEEKPVIVPEKKIVAEEKEQPKIPVQPEIPQTPIPPVEKKVPEPPKNVEPPKTSPSDSSRPRPDLKTFIGLNEKIMFLRHLFRNDTASYDEVIRQINSSSSLTEAITFTDVVKNEFAWKADDEIVVAFYDLIKRRFA